MQDFRFDLTVNITGKTQDAMLSYLKKHGQTVEDISSFVEDAITWYIIDQDVADIRSSDERPIQHLTERELLPGQMAVEGTNNSL